MLVLGVIVNCPNCNSNTIQKYKYTNTKYIKLILFLCRARVTTDHWRTHCRRIPSRWPAARWTPQTRSEKVRFVYYSALGKRWTIWRVNFFSCFFSWRNRWMFSTQSEKLSSFPQFAWRGFGCLRCWRFAGITETPQVYTHGDPLRSNWPDFS